MMITINRNLSYRERLSREWSLDINKKWYTMSRSEYLDNLTTDELTGFLKDCYEVESEKDIYFVAYDWSVFPIVVKYVKKYGCL